MQDTYYAKSKLINGNQPTVRDHLEAVSELAEQFGKPLDMEEEARIAGLFHDFGKYSAVFQNVLRGTQQGVDHAFPSAVYLNYAFPKKKTPALLETINGHHDGLLSAELLERTFRENLRTSAPLSTGKLPSLYGGEYKEAIAAFQKDFPDFPKTFPNLKKRECSDPDNLFTGNLEEMLHTRLLFSCLVDADYSVSASDENPDYLAESEDSRFDPAGALGTFLAYRETIRRGSHAKDIVNQCRDTLFEKCGKAGASKEGLFTLTAPTGTGKTLALLHFALQNCIAFGKKRIILVVPFLSLTEQTADTYRKVFPDVLEDHSQSDLTDQQREFAARWSAPVIITTTVNFFESLFASKPTDCRKLHHLADSVVLFDEVQSLPAELTRTTISVVNRLCEKHRVTMVFSTATQPAYEAIPGLKWKPTEINPGYEQMYEALRRVKVTWQIDRPLSFEELAEDMASYNHVCAIVNLRRHAVELFEKVREQCGEDGSYLLSTDLCAAHRRDILDEIKSRLASGQPCRVVATQCIEAGVDISFDRMYRALAPLDAIIQAAGRCNRGGELKEGGLMTVFLPEEEAYPGDWYHNAAQTVKGMLADFTVDITSPLHIRDYYTRVFREQKEKAALEEAICDKDYKKADEEYRLIEERGVQVIVPYAGKKELYSEAKAEAIRTGVTPGLLKKAAGITVTVPYGKQEKRLVRFAERLPYSSGRHAGKGRIPSNVFLLTQNDSDGPYYTYDKGLRLPEENSTPFFW